MSTSDFINGQKVLITSDHNHLLASPDTIYHIGQISRIQGANSVLLLKDSKCVGAVPEVKLKAVK